jgi:DUF971 family protein
MPESPANKPTSIKASREEGRLTIDWADGHVSHFEAARLRLACPCAFCAGEAGRPGWLATQPELTEPQRRLVDVRLVGAYAIAPSWADGHDTGYYTFDSLREMCPCPECTAGRSSTT